ncbi:MAG: cation diffusion facilitator family transporter [Oscillospiraceae bacterium]|nr:cation diffusion facilitator family transporter [Oscillospiraceae bacterium]
MGRTNEKLAMTVTSINIIENTVLTAFKMFAGIFGKSAAMVSDALHSLSDVVSTLIVKIGVTMANQAPDEEHPYGHERFECVAAVILSAILFITGAGIGINGIRNIISGNYGELAVPGMLALVAAIVSITVKEGMFWFTRWAAKKTDSSALMASAWHSRSDAFSSVGSFIGIFGARMGYPILDSVACIIICLLIIKVSVDIFKEAVGKMTDKAVETDIVDDMRKTILAVDQVIGIDLLRTRLFGNRIYVDVDIAVDGSKTLTEAHKVAESVHECIEREFQKVKHCTVHVNPMEMV